MQKSIEKKDNIGYSQNLRNRASHVVIIWICIYAIVDKDAKAQNSANKNNPIIFFFPN